MFSKVWIPQRYSRSYTEKRRGRKETEVARGIRGESKGERQIQTVISSLSVLHSLEHTKNSQNWVEKRRGREEIEVTWGRKRRVKSGRGQSNQ